MRNYSQKYVASKLGMSQNAYSKIENNITGLTVHHVKALSKILEVPVTDLLKDEFEIHKPFAMPRTVTKSDLLEHVHKLQKIIADKHHIDDHRDQYLRNNHHSLCDVGDGKRDISIKKNNYGGYKK